MDEIWKDITGYENKYLVSNFGRVKSLDCTHERATKGTFTIPGRVMAGSKDTRGYPQMLLAKNGNKKTIKVHRLVASAFIPNPDNKRTINHINGIRTDNRVENLEWATDSENIKHAFATGLMVGMKGEKHPLTKLSNENIREIRLLIACGKRGVDIAKAYNVNPCVISAIKKNKSWKHVI